MANPAPHRKYTIEDFVRVEQYSNVRHEFLDGQIYAMAGGTPEHGTYAANVIGLLASQLRERRCRIQTSDVRIRVTATGLDTYPDVSVVCGQADRDVDDPNAITNPVVLVEILSSSTEDYDRGEKLDHYKRIPAVREIVLVGHDSHRVDLVQRQTDGTWMLRTAGDGESVNLESIGCVLAVDDIYRDPLSNE